MNGRTESASPLAPRKRQGNLRTAMLAALMLAGCAGPAAYRDGRELAVSGKFDEALKKFELAVSHDPRQVEYRQALLVTREQAVSAYLQQAAQLAAAGKPDAAEKLYQRVQAIDPGNERARAGLRALDTDARHGRLMQEADASWSRKDGDNAQLKLRAILSENPAHSAALALHAAIAEKSRKPSSEAALAPAYGKPITIEFKDVALKQVFEVISRSSGLNFLFDKDVRTDQKTSIFLKNSNIASAIHFTLMSNQLEQQQIDANTVLIYPNTAAKQKDYQEMVVRTFFLSNAEAKTVANTLKTIVKSREVVIDEKLNMVIVRDTPDAIRIAEKLVALHDLPEPEVMLEVEILEVKRTRLLELGIKWPDSFTLTPLPGTTGGALTLRDLAGINNSTIGVGVSPLVVNARKNDSDAKILANPRIRARNHEKAKILIGERVPNITTTSTATGFVSESINYVDVGLKLDVEPSIYLDGDVAIKIALEVSNIVSQLQTKSGSVAYQIGTRTASTVLRLRDGENQVLAGLINDEDRSSAGKLPGFGDIPIIGRLFGSTADNTQKTEIVLSITPRLIRNIQRPDAALAEFRAGTDGSFRNRPDAAGGVPLPAAPTRSAQQPAPPLTPPANAPVAAPGANMPGAIMPGALPVDSGAIANAGLALSPSQLRWQGPTQLKLGSSFAVQLTMQADQPVSSLPITVDYDNKVLQVVGVTEGEFLKQGGAQTSFSSRIDANGQIIMSGSRAGEGGANMPGVPGVVATLNFLTLAPAEASMLRVSAFAPLGAAGRAIVAPLPAPYVIQVEP